MAGIYNPDGLIRITQDDSKTGAYTADGAWRVEDISTGPYVTPSGARRKDLTELWYRTVDEGIQLEYQDETLTFDGEILTYGN